MTLLICLEVLEHVKKTHFIENNEIGFEPFCGLVSVTDGSLMAVGHLFAASIVNGGAGACFFAPWVYHYIIGGLDFILLSCHRVLTTELYITQLIMKINLRNIVGKFLLIILY